jgi:hypothetical protein
MTAPDPVPEVPVDTGRAVVAPAVSTLRDEMAVSGQRLLAATGQIPMAAHTQSSPCDQLMGIVHVGTEHWQLNPAEIASRFRTVPSATQRLCVREPLLQAHELPQQHNSKMARDVSPTAGSRIYLARFATVSTAR